jgi:uracil-DNA glycosylase
MSDEYWAGRGFPWEYDPGPPQDSDWARLFAQIPNYRGLGVRLLGQKSFRWQFGPMFYRGRLEDNAVKVLVIGQDGAQDESLAHRTFTGGTGARMQHFLNHLGITRSYLFLNTFLYTIFGQYGDQLRWLAQDPASPIVQHRHEILNAVLQRNDVHLVVAVGTAAKETVVTWVKSRGGTCPAGAQDVSRCSGPALGPHTRIVGVVHPGGAGKGVSIAAITADFKRAANQVKEWIDADPGWLPPDEDGVQGFAKPYRYRSAPIPFRDYAYGSPWRLGQGGTSSNRKDSQRSIQIFSAGGAYNAAGASLRYQNQVGGSRAGYADDPGDLPYEPPKVAYHDYDRGPGPAFARLFMGGEPGLEWPDWNALGVTAHPSFGYGPIYRGRPGGASVLVLADQQGHDDLFTGRALSGESGQHLQVFLEAIGLLESYAILRVLPVDTLDLAPGSVAAIVGHPQVQKVYQAIVDRLLQSGAAGGGLGLALAVGPQARALAGHVAWGGLPVVNLKAWAEPGALQDWQHHLPAIEAIPYRRDVANPSFEYDGRRGQIPRADLPYGALRWIGTSGDCAQRAMDVPAHLLSPHYYKLTMPAWASGLAPAPLSVEEEAAIAHAPNP